MNTKNEDIEVDSDFIKEMAEIYARMQGKQEPLGSEFDKILEDYIESLYEA